VKLVTELTIVIVASPSSLDCTRLQSSPPTSMVVFRVGRDGTGSKEDELLSSMIVFDAGVTVEGCRREVTGAFNSRGSGISGNRSPETTVRSTLPAFVVLRNSAHWTND
jgi:hypothetical protein